MSGTEHLCFDIGGTKSAVAIMSETEGVIAREQFPTDGGLGPEQAVAKMISTARRLIEGRDLQGIGISVGAMFDPGTGVFGEAPHLPSWVGYPIVEKMSETFGLPVAADNDANACALAEWRYGAGKETNHMAFLTFGTGFGAGLILNRQIYHGASALAGEIGAIRVAETGPPVRDKPGCLEGFASGAGIAGLVKLRLPGFGGESKLTINASAADVAKAATDGDQLARAIMNESGDYLGRGLAIMLDFLNLEAIVIGSIFVRCENLLRPTMESALKRDAMPATRAACRILPAALGENIGDYAALALSVGQTSKG
jgi:glucokinase